MLGIRPNGQAVWQRWQLRQAVSSLTSAISWLKHRMDDVFFIVGDSSDLVALPIIGPPIITFFALSASYLAAFKTISDVTNIGSYVYDENNNFLFKESYNLAIDAYAAVANTDGVVALTDELIYILKAAGKQKGWYDPDSPNYLFSSTVVKTVNAWLFACCYYN